MKQVCLVGLKSVRLWKRIHQSIFVEISWWKELGRIAVCVCLCCFPVLLNFYRMYVCIIQSENYDPCFCLKDIYLHINTHMYTYIIYLFFFLKTICGAEYSNDYLSPRKS